MHTMGRWRLSDPFPCLGSNLVHAPFVAAAAGAGRHAYVVYLSNRFPGGRDDRAMPRHAWSGDRQGAAAGARLLLLDSVLHPQEASQCAACPSRLLSTCTIERSALSPPQRHSPLPVLRGGRLPGCMHRRVAALPPVGPRHSIVCVVLSGGPGGVYGSATTRYARGRPRAGRRLRVAVPCVA